MSNKPFHYQAPFPLKKDDTEYYLLTSEHVSVSEFEGQEILKVAPEALTLLARQAFHDASFMLRPAHQQQVADILCDPEASENDKYVALQFLRNSDIAAKGVLPTCQDTGTAIIVGKKGQRVWTGGGDEAALARGVYNTYIEDNLRYSQNAPLDMYKEVNTGTNLPAQIDLYAVDGDEYKFLCIAKGGGSANKTYLYQETKALLTPGKLKNYLVEKMRTLGTAACPPYHIAFVIGGTSAETNLKTVKLASADVEGRARAGGASSFLADRVEEEGEVRVFIEHNDNFRLPTNPETPVIMIGPGTGIAPFRAFMQQRAADEAPGKNWLFFGNPHFTEDFLYQVEWQRYVKEGVLTRIDLAWSRDQKEKIYVQDKLREQGAELWRWINDGAHIYVCGDANRMAKDVEQALLEVIAEFGGMDTEAADEFLSELRVERRYQRDVY